MCCIICVGEGESKGLLGDDWLQCILICLALSMPNNCNDGGHMCKGVTKRLRCFLLDGDGYEC